MRLTTGIRRLLLLILFPLTGYAQDTYLVATLGSYHAERDRGYNERNLGFGVEVHQSHEFRMGFGYYKNSYYRQSMYLFTNWLPIQIGEVRAGMSFGLVTGYEKHPVFVPVPTVSWEGHDWGFNLALTPDFAGLQVKYLLQTGPSQ